MHTRSSGPVIEEFASAESDIESEIERRRAYYDKLYGFVPAFKAGVHAGPVTTGQIGMSIPDFFGYGL